jgi:hypothetical protein
MNKTQEASFSAVDATPKFWGLESNETVNPLKPTWNLNSETSYGTR